MVFGNVIERVELEPGLTSEVRECPDQGTLVSMTYDSVKAGVMTDADIESHRGKLVKDKFCIGLSQGDSLSIDDLSPLEAIEIYRNHRKKTPIHPNSVIDYARFCMQHGKPVDVHFTGMSDGIGTLVRYQIVELRNVPPDMRKTGTYKL